jgi:hypothetical protein
MARRQSTTALRVVMTAPPVPLMTWLIPLFGRPASRMVTRWCSLTPGATGVSNAFSATTGAA